LFNSHQAAVQPFWSVAADDDDTDPKRRHIAC
jgi:hypothetical protein